MGQPKRTLLSCALTCRQPACIRSVGAGLHSDTEGASAAALRAPEWPPKPPPGGDTVRGRGGRVAPNLPAAMSAHAITSTCSATGAVHGTLGQADVLGTGAGCARDRAWTQSSPVSRRVGKPRQGVTCAARGGASQRGWGGGSGPLLYLPGIRPRQKAPQTPSRGLPAPQFGTGP